MPEPAHPAHPSLAAGRWRTLTFAAQMANIGSEVGRAAEAHVRGNEQRRRLALDRALELFDLTLADDRWRHRLKEVALTHWIPR